MAVDFSIAFKLLLGDGWYAVAQTFFVTSCLVQATSGIVQTAQCLDSLIATFILPKIYALQLSPTLDVVTWSADSCHGVERNADGSIADASKLSECTPFSNNGPLVISLGYVVMFLIYWPIGRGHIKETMTIQLLAFFSMFVFILIFDWGKSCSYIYFFSSWMNCYACLYVYI